MADAKLAKDCRRCAGFNGECCVKSVIPNKIEIQDGIVWITVMPGTKEEESRPASVSCECFTPPAVQSWRI
jgi:hypothetical protein